MNILCNSRPSSHVKGPVASGRKDHKRDPVIGRRKAVTILGKPRNERSSSFRSFLHICETINTAFPVSNRLVELHSHAQVTTSFV